MYCVCVLLSVSLTPSFSLLTLLYFAHSGGGGGGGGGGPSAVVVAPLGCQF